jgi:hypothetical protein
VTPLAPAQIGQALRSLFEGAGIPITQRDGRLMLTGVGLREKGGASV